MPNNNIHVENIINFRDFLNILILDIERKNYSNDKIKEISNFIDIFYKYLSNYLINGNELPQSFEANLHSDSDCDSIKTIASIASITSNSSELLSNEANNIIDLNKSNLNQTNDYYKSLYKQYKKEINREYNEEISKSNIISKKQNLTEYISSEQKKTDNIALDFLNNSLKLNNYYYLKNNNQKDIDNFCKLHNIY